MKIRISKLDHLFSMAVRTRDRWTCQRCGKVYTPPTNGLHCAHIFTRSKHSTRFDFANATAFCYGCHSWMDRNPLEKYAWYVQRFGQAQFDAVRLRSNTPRKVDRVVLELMLKQYVDGNEHGG